MERIDYGFAYNPPGDHCLGEAQPGARAMLGAILDRYPSMHSSGIYNCRPPNVPGGGSGLSTHAEGRGIDGGVKFEAHPDGQRLADELVWNARWLGVQRVIWDRREWDSRPGEQHWEPYGGYSHRDHVHIELCWKAAAGAAALTGGYVKWVLEGAAEPDGQIVAATLALGPEEDIVLAPGPDGLIHEVVIGKDLRIYHAMARTYEELTTKPFAPIGKPSDQGKAVSGGWTPDMTRLVIAVHGTDDRLYHSAYDRATGKWSGFKLHPTAQMAP